MGFVGPSVLRSSERGVSGRCQVVKQWPFKRTRVGGASGWLCQAVDPSISHPSDGEVVVDINKKEVYPPRCLLCNL
jgi:hypothetical protein